MKNFFGKKRVGTSFFNVMFYLSLSKKRSDISGRDFVIFMGFRVVPYFFVSRGYSVIFCIRMYSEIRFLKSESHYVNLQKFKVANDNSPYPA